MKYLSRFNEGNDEYIIEIAKDSMPELFDKGFRTFTVFNVFHLRNDDSPFEWNDVKDKFIQFIDLLTDEYDISHITLHTSGYNGSSNAYFVDLQNVLDDNLVIKHFRSNYWSYDAYKLSYSAITFNYKKI